MCPSQAHAVAQLRIEAFFEGSGRTVEEDAAGLLTLPEDGLQAALVAELDGRLAGAVLLVHRELDLDSERGPWLAGLVVKPQFRMGGIGSGLVRALETHACSAGCREVFLYTHAFEAFYARLGWEVAERFLQRGEPAVVMSRQLQHRA
jgi:predicted N-acetyltransferase YhbS